MENLTPEEREWITIERKSDIPEQEGWYWTKIYMNMEPIPLYISDEDPFGENMMLSHGSHYQPMYVRYKKVNSKIGNHEGALYIAKFEDKFYWMIENYGSQFDKIDSYEEISSDLYHQLDSLSPNK